MNGTERLTVLYTPHVLSVSDAEQVEIFCQRKTVWNLRVADAELSDELTSFVVLQHSTGAVAVHTDI